MGRSMMTLLVRTDRRRQPSPDEASRLEAIARWKPSRALDADAAEAACTDESVPVAGMSGTRSTFSYRGMKEYEIAFDGFEVRLKTTWVEGQGFKQLMATFESSHPDCWRAIGVAQSALEHALRYRVERRQFVSAHQFSTRGRQMP